MARPPWASLTAATMDNPRPAPPTGARAGLVGPVEAFEDPLGSGPRPGPSSSTSSTATVALGRPAAPAPASTPECGSGRWPAGWRRAGAAGPRRRPRQLVGGVEADRPLRLHGGGVGDGVGHHPGQVHRRRLERPSLVEAGEEQHLVDEHAHPGRFVLHPAHGVGQGLLIVQAALAPELGVAPDRRERRAQLVRRVGDEPPQPVLRRGPLGRRRSSISPTMVLNASPSRPASVRGSARSTRRDRSPAAMASAVSAIWSRGRTPRCSTNQATRPGRRARPGWRCPPPPARRGTWPRVSRNDTAMNTMSPSAVPERHGAEPVPSALRGADGERLGRGAHGAGPLRQIGRDRRRGRACAAPVVGDVAVHARRWAGRPPRRGR